MEIYLTTFGNLALGAAALLLIGFGLLHLRRMKRRINRQEQLLKSLESDMQAVCHGARGMGDAVVQLEQRLRKMTERQDSLDMREPDNRVYTQAIKLAHTGASVEELVSTCGLARSEAELVHLLHQSDESAEPKAHRIKA